MNNALNITQQKIVRRCCKYGLCKIRTWIPFLLDFPCFGMTSSYLIRWKQWFIMLVILTRWFYCILSFFVMSVELWSSRWVEILARSLSFYSSSVYTSQFVNYSCVLGTSVIPKLPEYFISTVFKWRNSTHRYLQRLEMAWIPLKIVNIYPY